MRAGPAVIGDAPLTLHDAAVCLDCERLFHIAAGRCPSCGSVYLALLATWVPPTVTRASR